MSVAAALSQANRAAPRPSVTVAIPAYQGAAHLATTIDSVLAQSFADFELLIVDDNSSDATAEIVSGYADRRIRYLRNASTLGAQGNWNRCLTEARGTYFKLLPQDDVLASECLAQQADVLRADADAQLALVFCRRNVVSASQKRIVSRGPIRRRDGRLRGLPLARRCLRFGTNFIGEPGGVLFRTALAREVGAFDASNAYVIDLDYWVRLLARGDAWYQSSALVSFRVSSASWSVAIGARQAEDVGRFIRRVASRPPYALGPISRGLGICIARVNALLRGVVYRLVLPGQR